MQAPGIVKIPGACIWQNNTIPAALMNARFVIAKQRIPDLNWNLARWSYSLEFSAIEKLQDVIWFAEGK